MHIASAAVNGLTVYGYENDYVFQSILKAADFYEANTLRQWLVFTENAKTILDVGANLGNHSLFWATHTQAEKIYAFEPYPQNHKILEKNIIENKLEDKIKPFPYAVGKELGKVVLHCIDENNLGTATFTDASTEGEQTIEKTSVDVFVQQQNIRRIDFVKIDTEGFETKILEGMESVLKRDHPTLWIEVSSESYKWVIDYLKKYRYYPADVRGFNMIFLFCGEDDWSEKCELQELDTAKLLKDMFYFQERTNAYYKAYNTAKEWVESKNVSLERQQKAYDSIKEVYQNLQTETNNLRQNLNAQEQALHVAERKIEEKNQLLNAAWQDAAALTKQIQELCGEIYNEKEEWNQEKRFLAELERSVQRMEQQNNYLKQENAAYRKKLSLITDTWYGRLGIKGYRILKKVKNALRKGK